MLDYEDPKLIRELEFCGFILCSFSLLIFSRLFWVETEFKFIRPCADVCYVL